MLKAQEIADSYINGNFKQFYEQVQEYGTFHFFNSLADMVPYNLFRNIVLRYLLSDQK